MKRIAFTVVSLLFVVAVCLSQFAEPKRAMAAAKPPAVVVLQCIIVNQGSPPTVVYAVDKQRCVSLSFGAPALG
jgi:hypothetical protein